MKKQICFIFVILGVSEILPEIIKWDEPWHSPAIFNDWQTISIIIIIIVTYFLRKWAHSWIYSCVCGRGRVKYKTYLPSCRAFHFTSVPNYSWHVWTACASHYLAVEHPEVDAVTSSSWIRWNNYYANLFIDKNSQILLKYI